MIRRREQSNSSLAFIDVMACGLGAVLLLFVLLDFEEVLITSEPQLIDITDNTQFDLMVSENSRIQNEISNIERQIDLEKANIAATIIETIETRSQVPSQIKAPAPIVETKSMRNTNNQGDLVGLKVEGSRILILLDSSASMSQERLIDVLVGVADPTGSLLSNGKKWAQAKRIVDWLIDAGPAQSQYQLLAFGDEAKQLTNRWMSSTDLKSQLPLYFQELQPNGATNLEFALEKVSRDIGNFSSLYLITDGLPTKASAKTRLLNVPSCGVNVRRKQANVSGICREALFNDSIKALRITGRPINVVLLPFEGDPMAAPMYWTWAAANQGRLFTPDQYWP